MESPERPEPVGATLCAKTQAIGTDLGLIAPAVNKGQVLPPPAQLTALPSGRVQLNWVNSGLDGVRIESQRGAETQWTQLDDDRYSPYGDERDERPNLVPGHSESRCYRLRYLNKDQPIGQHSDIAEIPTKP